MQYYRNVTFHVKDCVFRHWLRYEVQSAALHPLFICLFFITTHLSNTRRAPICTTSNPFYLRISIFSPAISSSAAVKCKGRGLHGSTCAHIQHLQRDGRMERIIPEQLLRFNNCLLLKSLKIPFSISAGPLVQALSISCSPKSSYISWGIHL